MNTAALNAAAFVAAADRSAGWPHFRFGLSRQRVAPNRIFQITNRLHDGRTARVPGNRIGSTVSAWLAELGADSPIVNDLARAACSGNWPAACAIGERLSVDVTVAA